MPFMRYRPLAIAIAMTAPAAAFAAGLDFPWHSASAMGTAESNAAEAADASTIYFNPAGLTRLHGAQKTDTFQALTIHGKFQDQGSTKANGNPSVDENNNGVIDGAEGAHLNGGTYHPKIIGAGQMYLSLPVDDMLTVGFGLFSPYGANLNYKSDWAGRYGTDRAAIESVILNPMAAIRFDDHHSIAAGLDIQAIHVNQKIQVDIQEGIRAQSLNTLKNLNVGPLPLGFLTSPLCNGLPQLCGIIGGQLTSSYSPGHPSLNIEGIGVGAGWNFGYMFSLDDRTRMSLSYRSTIRQSIKGKADWDFSSITGTLPNPSNPLQSVDAQQYISTGVRPDTSSRINLTTPDSLVAGIFHQVNDRLDLMASATWTGYSKIQELRVLLGDQTAPDGSTVKQGDAVSRTNFRDTIHVAIGANYRVDDKLMLRGGLGFDQTPIPNAQSRSAGAPDGNRFIASSGLNYRINRHFSVDLAYSFIKLQDVEADYTDHCHPAGYSSPDGKAHDGNNYTAADFQQCTGNGGTFKGRYYDTYIHAFGAQLNHKF